MNVGPCTAMCVSICRGALFLGLAFAVASANAATITPIYTLQDADGRELSGPMVVGRDGQLYGATSGGSSAAQGGTLFRVSPSGSFTKLVAFDGTNGANPDGGLVVGPDGNLYGVTARGGLNGGGTIFRATPSGTLTTIASPDGCVPHGSLVSASDGNLYGEMTCDYVVGWVFRVTAAGLVTRLANLDGYDLTQAADGNLYGVTSGGGTSNSGTVFRMTLSGSLTIFALDPTVAIHPYGRLAQGVDGNLYGVTYGGQRGDPMSAPGSAIIRVNYQGLNAATPKVTKVTDFNALAQPLLPARDGNLYGPAVTLPYFHSHIFAVSTAGAVTDIGDLGDSCPNCISDGPICMGPLVQAGDGTLYGAAGCDVATIVRVHRPTTLQSRGVISVRPLSQEVGINPQAVLNDAMTGAPVGGRWVGFWAGATYICGDWTGPDGVAKCQATVIQHADAILAGGVQAIFQDDGTFAQSKSTAEIVCVGNQCLP